MEYLSYFICFPEGEKQEIFHSLSMGDIVDINGLKLNSDELNPKKIAYQITGVSKSSHFKETSIYYKLDFLNRDEIIDEILYTHTAAKTKNVDLNKIFNDLEKSLFKKRK